MSKVRIVIPVLPCDVTNYVNAVESNGGEAVVKNSSYGFEVEKYDGLLLPGGIDIDPRCYGCANLACGTINSALDDLQETFLRSFVEAGKPVLGICRGHQLVNVYFGGDLIQDIPSRKKHSRDIPVGTDKYHEAEVRGDSSWLKPFYGDRFHINSSHHQASGKLGEGLVVDLYSSVGDEVVEAAHHEKLPIWTTQWHPERCRASVEHPDVVDGYKVFGFFLGKVKELKGV